MSRATLLAVPNVSEGRDRELIGRIARAFAPAPARVLDVHADPDHNRSVFTLAGGPAEVAEAVVAGARQVVETLDINRHTGVHPHVGALDVAPVVFLEDSEAGAACAEALLLGDRLGSELGLPVFLYGALGGGRTRSELRSGGLPRLAERMASGELAPDFGPGEPHPTAGAVLVSARPPLIAFNLELAAPATVETARAIAARIREGGSDGLPAVRAIGVWLEHSGRAQVSLNIEDHRAVSLGEVVVAVGRWAEVCQAELVGLAPRQALADFPTEIALQASGSIEDALQASD